MNDKKVIRKIAAIFVTDVVNYSTLMEKDENSTIQNLNSCKSILENLFKEHGGKIFNTAGDSILAEFQSAVSSVICASEFQKLIKERNKNIDEDKKMEFRIGLNMGDVIVEGTNLYGEGVNIAARLEALATPGGVCLSKTIYDLVAQKTDLIFNELGHQKVKNTDLNAYSLNIEEYDKGINDEYISSMEDVIKPPTIAVLPFKNMSNDEEQEYFADGITEDIISNLSQWKTFPVVSRNSSFSFKGTTENTKQVANSLGADYLVEGSVRKGGNKVRISAQLIFAADDKQIWSKRWDRSLEDIFEVQDEVSLDVASLISPALKDQEISKMKNKPKKNISAWDEYMQGLNIINNNPNTSEIRDKVIKHCKKAIDLDANFCDAYVLYCDCLTLEIYDPKKTEERNENEKLYLTLSEKAVSLDPENPLALHALGHYYRITNDINKSHEIMKKTFDLNPNHPNAIFNYGFSLAQFKKFDEALKLINKAIEIDPYRKNNSGVILTWIYIGLKDWENALFWINDTYDRMPHSRLDGWKSAVLALNDQIDDSKEFLKKFQKQRPEIKKLADYEKVAVDMIKDILLEGLKKAGLPE